MGTFEQKGGSDSHTAEIMNSFGQSLKKIGVEFTVVDTDAYGFIPCRFDMPYFSIEATQLFKNEYLDLYHNEMHELWLEDPFATNTLGFIDVGISPQSPVLVYLRLVFPGDFFGKDAGVTNILFETEQWIKDFLPEWHDEFPDMTCGLYMGRPFVANTAENRYETLMEIIHSLVNSLQAFAVFIFILFGELREKSDRTWAGGSSASSEKSIDSFVQQLENLATQTEKFASLDSDDDNLRFLADAFKDMAEGIASSESKIQEEEQRRQWIANGLCKHCGGTLGMFKKCKSCGAKN
jgi:hypothetical protein